MMLRLAYSDNAPSVKAVSVSGAVIAQTGTMSGGHQQGGSSWRRADASRLERERSSKHDQLTQARLRAQSLKDAVAPHTARRDACASTAKWAAKDAQLAQSRVAECEAREKPWINRERRPRGSATRRFPAGISAVERTTNSDKPREWWRNASMVLLLGDTT